VAPTAGFEPRFAAGVIQKGLPVPAELHRHLREKQATGKIALEHDPIPANHDLFRCDPPERRESGDLNVGLRQLIGLQWFKTRVLKGGGDGIVANRHPQRRDADHVTNAATKSAVDLEGHESASVLEQYIAVRFRRGEGIPVQATLNRLAREGKQESTGVTIDRVFGDCRFHSYQDGIVTA